VLERAARADIVVMAAAVSDYAPSRRAAQKVAKASETLTIVLEKTADILGELGARRFASGEGPILIGFAAETDDVVARARAKRESKRVDLIVANDVSRDDSGFEVDTNAVTLVGEQGDEVLPLQSKSRVASAILDRVETLLARRPA
jgi:phosphopantothenoylcysteine decarboxylase/phosphopantothenate--cysteine ligase